MTIRQILQPSPQHAISIDPVRRRVTVTFDQQVIAQSDVALALKEANYPPAIYIPRADVKMELLSRTRLTTYCPFKGDANYYSVAVSGTHGENAIWTYEAPFEAVASIKNHLAFYPDRFQIAF